MIIIPAIDLIEKKVVRLEQGDFGKKTVYSNNPVSVAHRWKECGARILHIVDLDGARTGTPENTDIVGDIVGNVGIDVQLGGGLRTAEDVERAFKSGVRFVVVGTGAVEDESFCAYMLDRYRNNLIFSVDAKNGKVAIKGWKKSLKIEAEEYIANLEQRGAKRIIYTDISKDGMMSGPNLKVLESVVRKTTMDVTASGGISDIDDIKALKRLEQYGLRSVIIGKALYEEKIDLKEAIRVGEENHSLP